MNIEIGEFNMNVLIIGLDPTLGMYKDQVIGDTQDRLILYGKYLTNLFVIVPPPMEMKLKVKKLSQNVTVYITSSRNLLFFVWDAYKIGKKICEENKIDLISVASPFIIGLVGYMLKRSLSIPLNVQLHGGECLDNNFWLRESKLHHILNILGKFVVKRADSIRAISKRLEDYLINNLNISPNRIINFPISIDPKSLLTKGQEATIIMKFSSYENIILFVGRLIKQKYPALLLKAAPLVLKKVPSTLFLIVGEGPERPKLEKLIDRLNIRNNVIFEGKVANDLLPSYYRSSTVFVFPSNYEGWGRVALEAMACGKPIVMTDVGCGGEAVVDGETGYVVPVGSKTMLAQRIIFLLENSQIREKMGKKCREYVLKTQNREKDGQKWLELSYLTVKLAQRR